MPPAAEPKQARAMETHRRLLAAAVDELLEHGYARLSTSGVARRAGVSRGAQQNYFPHKATLVLEAVRHLGRLQRDELQARITAVPRGRARVKIGLDSLFEVYSGPLFAAVVELSLAARGDAELREVVRAEERATARVLQELAREILGDDYEQLAPRWASALSAIRGLALLRLLGHPGESVDRQWSATRGDLLRLLERG